MAVSASFTRPAETRCWSVLDLIRIVDSARAEAGRNAGDWIVCRAGCYACCLGPFPISQLDAARLRAGLESLDPERAARVRERVAQSAGRTLSDDEPCPALDPQSGTCDLYEARPLTCRTFGPAVRGSSGTIGVCELCFNGATDEEIAACAVDLDTDALEEESVETTVAAALL
jgi:Fe-S-cluster containining protein